MPVKKKNIHHLHIMLTPEQYQLLSDNARQCGITKRLFIVRLLEGTEVKARPSQEIKALRTEIHHIGNNINQIARSVNAGSPKRRMPGGDCICWIRFMS